MSTFQERYNGRVVAANTTITLPSVSIGGFLCKVSGTISVVDAKGTTVVDTHPVTAGGYYPLPLYLGGIGGTFTTASNAVGTLYL